MFNLTQQVSLWKLNLKSKETFSNDNIDELESHLLETVDMLKASGLNDEESYWVAQRRIGGIDSLNIEYEKINRALIFRRKLFMLILGYMTFSFLEYFFSLSTYILPVFAVLLNADIIIWTYVQNIIFMITLISFYGIITVFILKDNFLDKFISKKLFVRKDILIKSIVWVYLPLILVGILFFNFGQEYVNNYIWKNSFQFHSLSEYFNTIKMFSRINMIVISIMAIIMFYSAYFKQSKLMVSSKA